MTSTNSRFELICLGGWWDSNGEPRLRTPSYRATPRQCQSAEEDVNLQAIFPRVTRNVFCSSHRIWTGYRSLPRRMAVSMIQPTPPHKPVALRMTSAKEEFQRCCVSFAAICKCSHVGEIHFWPLSAAGMAFIAIVFSLISSSFACLRER